MAWQGYMTWAGVEMINTARTERYAKAAGWFKPIYPSDLAAVLGHTYTQPVQDSAPWLDRWNLNLQGFWGVYPLNISGLEDDTITAVITESILEGAVATSQRRTSKAIVFNLVLVGANEAAVEAGFGWLKTLVTNKQCDGVCAGDTICFLASAPCVDWDECEAGDDPTYCYPRLARSLNKVTVVNAPTVTSKQTMGDGGEAWTVSMTAVAADPYVYGNQNDLIYGFMGTGGSNIIGPYVQDTPPGGSWDDDGTKLQDETCNERTWQPLADPLCPSVIAPPQIPAAPLSCFDFPVNFTRRWITIPAQFVSQWGDIVPRFVFRTGDQEVRPLRLRMYLVDNDDQIDECNYCADLLISYLPAGAEFVIDGVTKTIWASVDEGPQRRADSLVFGSDGAPFDWPTLACGYAYKVTVDLTNSQIPPVMDVTLYTRTP